MPTVFGFGLARYLAATAPAAPVLKAVIHVPPMIASGAPVLGSTNMIVAMTVGNPCFFRFSGCEFTTFTETASFSSRYAGMVLTSPLYFFMKRYCLGGIWA